MVRRSTGGTRNPDRSNNASGTSCDPEGQGDHGDAGGLDRGELRRGVREHARRGGGRWPRRGWRARPRRPRSSRRSWSGRRSAPSPTAYDAARGRSPRCAPRSHRRRRPAAGSRPIPPGRAGEDRGDRGRHAGGLLEQAAAAGHGEQLRHGRGRRDAAGVAGVHASEQRLDEAVDELVAEPRRDQVADRDVVVDGGDGLGARAGQALGAEHAAGGELRRGRRGRPSASAASCAGTPRDHTADVAGVGWTTSAPSSAASASPSGRRASIASAPTSTVSPATSPRRSLPPTWGEPSSSRTSRPVAAMPRAATRPAIPPPTTTASRLTPPPCQRGWRRSGTP